MIPTYFILVCINKVPVSLDAQGTLDIGLPTLDIYSDLALSTKLFINRRTIWATSILVPFLVNYVLGWRAWIEEEKRIFVLLDVDGQDHLVRLEAARRRCEAKDTFREERQI